MVARKNVKITSNYERICERILRAITYNRLIDNVFLLANAWNLNTK